MVWLARFVAGSEKYNTYGSPWYLMDTSGITNSRAPPYLGLPQWGSTESDVGCPMRTALSLSRRQWG